MGVKNLKVFAIFIRRPAILLFLEAILVTFSYHFFYDGREELTLCIFIINNSDEILGVVDIVDQRTGFRLVVI